MKIQAYALQDIGKRDNQEDAFFPPFLSPGVFGKEGRYDTIPHTDDRLFLLCDGMGGHEHGEVASATVCEVMGASLRKAMEAPHFDVDAAIAKAVNEALDALDAKSLPPFGKGEEGKGSMGCTMTLLLFHDKGATIAHIGDSRVYHFRSSSSAALSSHSSEGQNYAFLSHSCEGQSRILFRTEDHSYVNMLVQSGVITMAQARTHEKRNVLMRAMMANVQQRPVADIYHTSDILPGDIFFLCSDGMLEEMCDEDLCSILTHPSYSDEERLQILLKFTEGNKDNHTAWMVRVRTPFQSPTPSQFAHTPILSTSDFPRGEERIVSNERSGAFKPSNVTSSSSPRGGWEGVGGREGGLTFLPQGTKVKGVNHTYTIERMLGHGAYGVTYLATMKVPVEGDLGSFTTDVNVTLKEFFMMDRMERKGTEVVRKRTDDDIDTFARCFFMEADKLSTLSHPNIVKVLEVFVANNTCYYVMEYLPGGTLADYIMEHDGIDEREAILFMHQICSALSYMHSKKMLHLDLKPGNMMLSKDKQVKLIDYGLATQYAEDGEIESEDTLGCGTPGYSPLEQSDRTHHTTFTPTLDIYALGATYYKMLTGITPPRAVNVMNMGLDMRPLVDSNVSQQSIDAIKAAMDAKPDSRPQTVDEFLNMLPSVKGTKIKRKRLSMRTKLIYALIALAGILIALWVMM